MIDIIIPCYNAEKYIEEAISSVMKQDEKEFNIICVDDCSTDRTYEILLELEKKYNQITVLKNENNKGIAATRNRAIAQSSSEYIAFFDNDDIMPPYRLKICKEYLEANPDVGVVAGNYLIFDESGSKKIVQKSKLYTAAQVRSELPFVNIIPNGTTLIRRSILEKNNISFQESYGIEDYLFYSEISKVADINVLLLEHRVMETQYSSVCLNSKDKFDKRQAVFDKVHRILMDNIAKGYKEDDMKVYTRFTQENIKEIKIKELFELSTAYRHFRTAVKKKGNADYDSFCKASRLAMLRAVKAYCLGLLR